MIITYYSIYVIQSARRSYRENHEALKSHKIEQPTPWSHQFHKTKHKQSQSKNQLNNAEITINIYSSL